MDEEEQVPEEYVDAVSIVQNVLAGLDPSALCTGFVAIVEWIEEDGSPSLSMVHSPMQPWHLNGMLSHATKYHDLPVMVLGHEGVAGEEDDEHWDEM